MRNHNWDDNAAKVFLALFNLVKEFKVVVSIIALAGTFALGWLDVPVFQAIVDGLSKLVTAGVTGIGL